MSDDTSIKKLKPTRAFGKKTVQAVASAFTDKSQRKLTPQTPSEFITAGYVLAHVSDDGLVFVFRKGHNFARVACEIFHDGADSKPRVIVKSVIKIP